MYCNMPKFKEKNTRKILVENISIVTLDGKHQEIIDELRRAKDCDIPALLDEQKLLRVKVSSKNSSIDEILETKDRLKEIKRAMREIKERESNYLLNNSELVFGYFEIIIIIFIGN